MQQSVIVSAVRTPVGKFLGALKEQSATELGALVIREAVRRAGIEPDRVDECIMGNVVSAGIGQAPARQAALRGGLADHTAALTINKVCGSGLKAVMLAAQAIQAGDVNVVVAGGMESMSNGPFLLRSARDGLRMGHAPMLDAVVHDGLWCAFEDWHMGNAGEVVAAEYHVNRECQDRYALRSHVRAAAASAQGRFNAEIVPVRVPQRKGEDVVVTRDESVRPDATSSALAALKPAFKKDGTVTAGNAPPVNDGAAAVVVTSERRAAEWNLKPIARIVGQATAGLPPRYLLMTPVPAVRRLLEKVGWTIDQVDLVELNEAFSAQAVAVIRELQLDEEKVNVNGGAVAIGHPIGASGARILTTLLHALEQRKLKRGIATLCLGGGNGVALAVERV